MASERFEEVCGWCNALCDQYPDAEWGVAHVVVSDFNFGEDLIKSTIQRLNLMFEGRPTPPAKLAEFTATRDVLVKILRVPESERLMPPPDDFDYA